ncbi:hypothetical protein ACFQPF_12445 [Fictibacillus iocasae]|uniref:Integral membrane protein n=1 Tax=Fictibacillus iocasae TaxID=2715437 RepID=A0ABW2NT18_9BACL
MDFILTYKWQFLIAAEILFWLFLVSFLVLRYWFKLHKISALFFILFIVNDLWIATMAFFDYQKTGQFSAYQFVIIIFILYAFTYGKSDFKKLDRFIQVKVAQLKGEPVPEFQTAPKLYGRELAKQERKHFAIHLAIFCIAHLAFFFLFGLHDQLSEHLSLQEIYNSKEGLYPFNNTAINNLSRIWGIILLVDAIISLSYTVFPKEEKKSVFLEK